MQIWPLRIMEAFDECVKTGTIGNDAHDATTRTIIRSLHSVLKVGY